VTLLVVVLVCMLVWVLTRMLPVSLMLVPAPRAQGLRQLRVLL